MEASPPPFCSRMPPAQQPLLSSCPLYILSLRGNSTLLPQGEDTGAASCIFLKVPPTASPSSQCLLSSRRNGPRQWLGEAVLAKVPGDLDGGEVQVLPYGEVTFKP